LLCICLCVTLSLSCVKWDLYKQCDPKWGSHKLGTSTNTICAAGCAMSDVSMILASEGIKIEGKESTPLTLNDWLVTHHGYISGDLLVWNAIAVLGDVSLHTYTAHLTTTEIGDYVKRCWPVVANVRDGSHWVLITGATSNPDVWRVNDPGFNQDTYTYNTMLRFVVYQVGKSLNQTEPVIAVEEGIPKDTPMATDLQHAAKLGALH